MLTEVEFCCVGLATRPPSLSVNLSNVQKPTCHRAQYRDTSCNSCIGQNQESFLPGTISLLIPRLGQHRCTRVDKKLRFPAHFFAFPTAKSGGSLSRSLRKKLRLEVNLSADLTGTWRGVMDCSSFYIDDCVYS